MTSKSDNDHKIWVKSTLTAHSVKLENINKTLDKVEILLKEQNSRIKTNEQDLTSFKTGISVVMFFVIILSSSGLLAALILK